MAKLKISNLKFRNPIVEEVSYHRNMEYDKEKATQDFFPEATVNISFQNDNKATVSLIFSIGQKEDSNPYFSFCAVASADFMWENLEKETAVKQLKISAPAMLLSYIRPLLTNLTVQSGLPPYQLPFIDFTQTS